MAKVTGIGGVFFKANDPQALAQWYATHLGVTLEDWGGVIFDWAADQEAQPAHGLTVWSLTDASAVEELRTDGIIGDRPAMAKPRRDGIPVERLIEQARSRGVDAAYQAWNVAGLVLPYADSAPLAWIADDRTEA
jgi:hypothetical protein